MVQIAVNFSHTSIFHPRQFFAHVNISSVLFSRFFQKREKRENITGAKKTRFTVTQQDVFMSIDDKIHLRMFLPLMYSFFARILITERQSKVLVS